MRIFNFDAIGNLMKLASVESDPKKSSLLDDFYHWESMTRCIIPLPIYIQLELLDAFAD